MDNPEASEDNADDMRHRLGKLMHSKPMHGIGMCLLVLDAIFVLLLLLVDLDVIPVSEDDGHDSKKEEVENGLHYTGLSILSLFVLEIMLKVIADGSSFFKQKLEVFDAAVVLASFILDIALSLSRVSSFVRDIVILMILLRLWRFFKLLVSVNICVRKDIQNQVEAERELRLQAEKERDDAREKLKLQEEQCQRPVIIINRKDPS